MSTKAEKSKFSKIVSDNGIWVVLVVLILAIGMINHNFLTVRNATALLTGESVKGVLTFGVMLAILSKGIDLSTGSVAALSAIISAALCQQETATKLWSIPTMPWIVGVLGGVGIGLLVGFANGWMVAYLRLHPFIATLGTQLICRASCKLIAQGPVSKLTPSFRFFGNGKVGPFHMIVIVLVIFFLISAFMLKETRFGKSVYAVGGNDQAARVAGINVESVLIRTYMWCSLCAAVGGILLAGRSDSADPANTGLNYELDAIAAATVGGTSQTGGICRISGVAAGILIMGVINNGMVMMGVNDQMTFIVKGLIIIGSVAFDMRKNNIKA